MIGKGYNNWKHKGRVKMKVLKMVNKLNGLRLIAKKSGNTLSTAKSKKLSIAKKIFNLYRKFVMVNFEYFHAEFVTDLEFMEKIINIIPKNNKKAFRIEFISYGIKCFVFVPYMFLEDIDKYKKHLKIKNNT